MPKSSFEAREPTQTELRHLLKPSACTLTAACAKDQHALLRASKLEAAMYPLKPINKAGPLSAVAFRALKRSALFHGTATVLMQTGNATPS